MWDREFFIVSLFQFFSVKELLYTICKSWTHAIQTKPAIWKYVTVRNAFTAKKLACVRVELCNKYHYKQVQIGDKYTYKAFPNYVSEDTAMNHLNYVKELNCSKLNDKPPVLDKNKLDRIESITAIFGNRFVEFLQCNQVENLKELHLIGTADLKFLSFNSLNYQPIFSLCTSVSTLKLSNMVKMETLLSCCIYLKHLYLKECTIYSQLYKSFGALETLELARCTLQESNFFVLSRDLTSLALVECKLLMWNEATKWNLKQLKTFIFLDNFNHNLQRMRIPPESLIVEFEDDEFQLIVDKNVFDKFYAYGGACKRRDMKRAKYACCFGTNQIPRLKELALVGRCPFQNNSRWACGGKDYSDCLWITSRHKFWNLLQQEKLKRRIYKEQGVLFIKTIKKT
jgi:hypothetical protein